jgi:CubicO group peptidase (beta-lactamase class C family)
MVVDLWGGVAERRTGRPWTRDTSAVIFSCTKGILAICVYVLVQAGRLDLDAPVADYWPEFAQEGKQLVTGRMLLAHRAGLVALDRDLTTDDVLAWEPVIRAIEAQRPLWTPGTAHAYHALTYGWLVGELIRRVTGQRPGRFFREEIGGPLGLRTWIGLPGAEQASVAWTEPPLPDADPELVAAYAATASNPMTQRSLTLNGAIEFPFFGAERVIFNDPAIRAAEIPAANGVSTARSLARLYAGCVSDIGGPRILTNASVDDALVPRSWGPSLYGEPDVGQRWGTGFMLASPPHRPMLGGQSFGHDGAGGQLAFADREREVGFAYLTNQMGGLMDLRANELVRVMGECLA